MWAGGIAHGTIAIGRGAHVRLFPGGEATSVTLYSGAQLYVSSTGYAAQTTVYGGGSEEFVFSGGIAAGTTVSSGGFEELGFYISGFQDLGGTAIGTIVSAGGLADVWSAGLASAATVTGSAAVIRVHAGGHAVGANLESGGLLSVFSGGTAAERPSMAAARRSLFFPAVSRAAPGYSSSR